MGYADTHTQDILLQTFVHTFIHTFIQRYGYDRGYAEGYARYWYGIRDLRSHTWIRAGIHAILVRDTRYEIRDTRYER